MFVLSEIWYRDVVASKQYDTNSNQYNYYKYKN